MLGAILGSSIGSAVSGIFGAKAAEKAAKRSLAFQKQQYEEMKGMAQPYMDMGTGAAGLYSNATGVNGLLAQKEFHDNFQTDPGWEAANKFAMKGIERSAAARSSSLGGNTLAGLYDYGQKNMWGAYSDRLGQLGNQIGWGQNAMGTVAGANNTLSQGGSQSIMNAGMAQAGMFGAIGQAGQNGLQNYMNYSKFMAGQGAGGGV